MWKILLIFQLGMGELVYAQGDPSRVGPGLAFDLAQFWFGWPLIWKIGKINLHSSWSRWMEHPNQSPPNPDPRHEDWGAPWRVAQCQWAHFLCSFTRGSENTASILPLPKAFWKSMKSLSFSKAFFWKLLSEPKQKDVIWSGFQQFSSGVQQPQLVERRRQGRHAEGPCHHFPGQWGGFR